MYEGQTAGAHASCCLLIGWPGMHAAGVTRPNRPGIDVEAEPPAVRICLSVRYGDKPYTLNVSTLILKPMLRLH